MKWSSSTLVGIFTENKINWSNAILQMNIDKNKLIFI